VGSLGQVGDEIVDEEGMSVQGWLAVPALSARRSEKLGRRSHDLVAPRIGRRLIRRTKGALVDFLLHSAGS
jgi:hypothetical protein